MKASPTLQESDQSRGGRFNSGGGGGGRFSFVIGGRNGGLSGRRNIAFSNRSSNNRGRTVEATARSGEGH